jgi:hypothetical protein
LQAVQCEVGNVLVLAFDLGGEVRMSPPDHDINGALWSLHNFNEGSLIVCQANGQIVTSGDPPEFN